MRVVGPLDIPIKKLKKGGLRSGAGSRNVPHIQQNTHLPDINYGAVAAAGRVSHPAPGLSRAPGLGQRLPTPQTVDPIYKRLAREQRKANQQQRLGLSSVEPLNPQGERKIKEITREKRLGVGKYKPIQAGVLPIEHLGGPLGIAQTLLTQVGQTAIGVGPGMYHLGGGMIHDPEGTTAMMVHQFAHSMGQTIHHPRQQLHEDPLGLITNVLIPLGATAGTAARVAEFSRTADALRAGEITNAQAVSQIGKTLIRPHPQQRSIDVGGGLRVSPPAFKGALGGYMQTKVLDPFFEHAIKAGHLRGTKDKLIAVGRELKMPEQMRAAMPEGHVGKLMRRDIEQQMQMRRGLEEVKQAKMMGEGTTTLYHGGPQDLEGGVLDAGRAHPSNYFGGGVYATDSPEIAKIYSLTHSKPLVHKLEVYSKSLANADAPMTKEMLKALEPHIGPVPKGTTLRQVFEDINNRASAGYHDLVKPVGHPRKWSRMLGDLPEWDKVDAGSGTTGLGHMDPKFLKKHPWARAVPIARMPDGEIRVGFPGMAHEDSVMPEDMQRHGVEPYGSDPWRDMEKKGYLEGTGIVDPETGKVVQVNTGHDLIQRHGGTDMRGGRGKNAEVEQEMKAAASHILAGHKEGPPADVLPRTIQQALSEIGIHGMHYKGLTDAGDLKSLATITGKAGADLKSAMGKVGRHRESVIWNPEDALHEGPPQLSAGEAQKRAYAIGAAKTHHDVWRSLYDGGAGYAESFAHDPKGYVGIRKPPDEIKWKGYSSEAGVGRKFQEMIETNPEKIAADPHAYSFIPRGMWQRMKLFTPGTGPLAKTADVIDRGTQMIRIGRFLHPGYAAWAVQNGILHATQAGMFGFRNAWQLRHEFSRLTDEEKAVFDNAVGAGHFGGGIARASAGSESSKFAGFSKKLAGFWHKVDDRYWRRMSLIHELNHQGHHSAEDWAKLMRENNPEFRKIGRLAQQEAIDYSEMSPSERATFQKLFTAWGWTRGASTYTMRYPLQHPVQFQAMERIGAQGKKHVEDYYAGKNGMVPNWLRGYLPIGHGNRPFMLSGGLLNPGETFGNVLGEIPGATKGQTESLAQEEAPVPASLQEMATGMTRFGQQLRGNQRFTQPFADLAKRFTPFSDVQSLRHSKKGAGTFEQGPQDALARFLSVPISRLNDAKQAAALGMRDYEQSLSRPDEINFRYHMSVQRLDQEAHLFRHRTGNPVSNALMSKVKGDLDAVHTRDMFQYSYAKSHGANSYRSLPAVNRLRGAIEFMTQHKYLSTEEASRVLITANRIKDDNELASLANELWSDTGIGSIASSWASTVKDLQKPTLTPARP